MPPWPAPYRFDSWPLSKMVSVVASGGAPQSKHTIAVVNQLVLGNDCNIISWAREANKLFAACGLARSRVHLSVPALTPYSSFFWLDTFSIFIPSMHLPFSYQHIIFLLFASTFSPSFFASSYHFICLVKEPLNSWNSCAFTDIQDQRKSIKFYPHLNASKLSSNSKLARFNRPKFLKR